ncbi:multicopper oxidase domain-containing protein [Marinomonas sp. C2222]|uniref:Multicopper oxidase domain-containing protein n=1 Tax=Marinomonas sargassi TaxID=2984494 RepID=A0ABT2YVU2_9GAMM|nr:multicopper oxidase domain-containing protein [Marinomonas sargassi]MCV2403973.1 multicopper oxidase domain-containing protein [Marinomonas sargassi]
MKALSSFFSRALVKKVCLSIFVLLALLLSGQYYANYVYIMNGNLSFTNPVFVPPLLSYTEDDQGKHFELVVQEGRKTFLPNQESATFGFNGDYLGPTVRVSKGDYVHFNISNQLKEVTTVHWHGMHVPPEMDGTPHQTIQPGESWQAHYPIMNEASTMWYHPHTHGRTATQAYNGLAGFFLIDDENSSSLELPNEYGVDDIPLAIQDRIFDNDGALLYEMTSGAFYGKNILVNGTYNPVIDLPARKVRLRLLNGSNARIYYFGFSDDRSFHQIATDGGLLESPVETKRVRLSPGERAEIVVDLSDAKEVLLKSYPESDLLTITGSVWGGVGNSHFDILKIRPQATDKLSPPLPNKLNTIERWSTADVAKTRIMNLGGGVSAPSSSNGRTIPSLTHDHHTDMSSPELRGRGVPINGSLMKMDYANEVVKLGDIEIWEVTNLTGQSHPFHIHDVQFLLLDRDGKAAELGESGWKDTVLVDVGETVRVIMKFTDYASDSVPYMYHCHIMEHEDLGMMGQFLVIE